MSVDRIKKLRWGIFGGACLAALSVYLFWPSASLEPSAIEESSGIQEPSASPEFSTSTESSALPESPEDDQAPRTIAWPDLMPESDLEAILDAPEITHDGEEEFYSLPMQGLSLDEFELEEGPDVDEATRAFQEALVSTKVRSEFEGQKIRIPGFMVPVALDGPKNVTEFFLVPYFGACIHMPPPPPNQIIHIKHPQGYYLEDLFTPVWVVGTAHTSNYDKRGVKAVYSMSEVEISLYYDAPEGDGFTPP